MRAAVVLLSCALAACAPEAPPAPMPDASGLSLEGLRARSVHGRIGGRSFQVHDARFRVVTRAGRERVDIFLADRPIERCGLPMTRDDTRVWIRFSGRTAIDPGTYALEGEEGEDFDVHYERPNADGVIESVHRGVARLEIRSASAERVRGVTKVCFADTERSCVEGAFDARPCLSRIDGRAIREPPGLSDEVLEAVGEGAR